jgi:hypothetical protein
MVFGKTFLDVSLSVLTKFHLISFHLGPKSFSSHEFPSYLAYADSLFFYCYARCHFIALSVMKHCILIYSNKIFKSLTHSLPLMLYVGSTIKLTQ